MSCCKSAPWGGTVSLWLDHNFPAAGRGGTLSATEPIALFWQVYLFTGLVYYQDMLKVKIKQNQ